MHFPWQYRLRDVTFDNGPKTNMKVPNGKSERDETHSALLYSVPHVAFDEKHQNGGEYIGFDLQFEYQTSFALGKLGRRMQLIWDLL